LSHYLADLAVHIDGCLALQVLVLTAKVLNLSLCTAESVLEFRFLVGIKLSFDLFSQRGNTLRSCFQRQVIVLRILDQLLVQGICKGKMLENPRHIDYTDAGRSRSRFGVRLIFSARRNADGKDGDE